MICPGCAAEIPSGFKFCGNCGQKLDSSPPGPVPPPPLVALGERREVTILFADVSGFTAMCERLDPEDVHAVMNECFAGLGQAIQGEDGHIDKYIGDNVMALFGAPTAHEDDPARACRAALQMQVFLRGFAGRCERRTGVRLRMRIGINCGLVVAGGVGSEVRMDYSVMGDTVNLASRLESAAPPGGVLISREVAKRSRGLFELGPARQISVKGKEQPVEALELLRERSALDPRGRDELSVELVGRERELGELVEQLRSGTPRRITVDGDIGIGKTRLVEEAARRLGARLLTIAGTTSARRPFGLVRRLVLGVLAEVTGGPWPETRDDFVAALARLGDDPALFVDALWHLAAPSELAVPPPDGDPPTSRRMIERSVVALLALLSRHAPGLVLFIDAWELADEASAALLTSLGPSGAPPLPVLITSRDAAPPLRRDDAVLHIEPLSAEGAASLLDRLVHGADLPPSLRDHILDRAAGVPLYLEEMVRALVDRGTLVTAGPDGAWTCDPDAARMTVPPSILGAMMARLDTLDRSRRELVSQCSVQGVEFDVEVARAIRSGSPTEALLPDLERRGVVVDPGMRPTIRAFRQRLMQEAAYETLLLRDRRLLHVETARALCDVAGGAERVAAELLAHHYERAEQWVSAADANIRAGDHAGELFLNDEATRRYQRALENLGPLESAPETGHLKAAAYRGLARVSLRVGRFAAASEHAARMRESSLGAEDRAEADRLTAAALVHTGRTADAEALLVGALAAVPSTPAAREVAVDLLFDLGELQHRAGRTAAALARLEECRARAGAADLMAALRADMLEGTIAHTEGRFADAARLYARACDGAERVGSLSERARAANNLGVVARDVGDYATAAAQLERALAIWERTGDTECIAGVRTNLGNVAMSHGDLAAAREHHERALAACQAMHTVHGTALAQANLAILAVEAGAPSEAIARAEAALGILGESENAVLRALTLAVLGEARLAERDVDGAEEVFATILETYDESTHPLAITTAWRGRGRVALLRDDLETATGALDRALEGFERLQRAQEAARTALDRAEALWRRGHRDEARRELERTRERFAAMGAERDRARADRLLRDLLASA